MLLEEQLGAEPNDFVVQMLLRRGELHLDRVRFADREAPDVPSARSIHHVGEGVKLFEVTNGGDPILVGQLMVQPLGEAREEGIVDEESRPPRRRGSRVERLLGCRASLRGGQVRRPQGTHGSGEVPVRLDLLGEDAG